MYDNIFFLGPNGISRSLRSASEHIIWKRNWANLTNWNATVKRWKTCFGHNYYCYIKNILTIVSVSICSSWNIGNNVIRFSLAHNSSIDISGALPPPILGVLGSNSVEGGALFVLKYQGRTIRIKTIKLNHSYNY